MQNYPGETTVGMSNDTQNMIILTLIVQITQYFDLNLGNIGFREYGVI